MLRVLAAGVVLTLLVGCSTQQAPGNTTTPGIRQNVPTLEPTRATVTDLSAPFDVSETDALVARGFQGVGSLGRLNMGCTLDVVRVTDRAVQAKLIDCPNSDERTPPRGTPGWVARSALSLR